MAKLSSVNVETETASTSITEACSGSHLFKVMGYSLDKGLGGGQYIASDIFTVGGYDWTIRYYPDGKLKSTENHLSFAVVNRNTSYDSPKMGGNITLTMLSQTGGTPLKRCTSVENLGDHAGYFPKFINRKEFEASDYLKNDSFTVRCTVSLNCRKLKRTNCKAHPFAMQPSNLHQQLTGLLQSGNGTDVSFNVNGVTFDAHRCVLAAQSPVFNAQFFGPMKDKVNESIEIKDMEPSIFKSMLHFIYSHSVPELEEVKDDNDASIALTQHLLVAADRYGLERLKQLCEEKLYNFTDANNVATTLILAVQHNCSVLKTACIEFIKQPEVFVDVLQSEGFEHMIKSCPGILEELQRMKNDGC